MQRRTVADVMTWDVVTVVEETPFMEIVRTFAKYSVKAVPVIDRDRRVIGIISDADLLGNEEDKDRSNLRGPPLEGRGRRDSDGKATAADLMTTPVVTVTIETPLVKAARTLARHGHQQAPVVDRAGRLAGTVAGSDLPRSLTRSDDDVRDEIIREVLMCGLWQDPSRIDVRMRQGVARLAGRLETKSLIPLCERLAASIEGVVDVVNDLSYDFDDTRPVSYSRA